MVQSDPRQGKHPLSVNSQDHHQNIMELPLLISPMWVISGVGWCLQRATHCGQCSLDFEILLYFFGLQLYY